MTFDQKIEFLGRHISAAGRLMCTRDGGRLVVWAPVVGISSLMIETIDRPSDLAELANDIARRCADRASAFWVSPGRFPVLPITEPPAPQPPEPEPPEPEEPLHDSAIRFSLLELD